MHAEIHGSGIVGGSQTRRLNKMSKKRRALEASLGLNDGTQVESMIKDCSSIQSINNLEDPGMVNFQKISKISKIKDLFCTTDQLLYFIKILLTYLNCSLSLLQQQLHLLSASLFFFLGTRKCRCNLVCRWNI